MAVCKEMGYVPSDVLPNSIQDKSCDICTTSCMPTVSNDFIAITSKVKKSEQLTIIRNIFLGDAVQSGFKCQTISSSEWIIIQLYTASNGNRTEWSPTQFAIIRVITKSNDHTAGVNLCSMSMITGRIL